MAIAKRFRSDFMFRPAAHERWPWPSALIIHTSSI
jgi:hypothetical protein